MRQGSCDKMLNINNNFKKTWFSRMISIIGTGLTEFGVSVWVFTLTGKATPMAITMLCSIIPSIFFAPLSGVISDRFNRKWVIILSDSIAMFASLFLLLFVLTGQFHFGVICIFSFISAAANMFDNNAYQASISTLVEDSELKTANGLNQVIDSLNSIAAPIIAGVLYFIIGLKGIIFIDIISYVISMLLFIKIPSFCFTNVNLSDTVKESGQLKISAGFRFIFSQKGLTLLMILFALLNFLFNLSSVLIEPLSLSLGNSVHLGVVKTCGGLGLLGGSLFITLKKLKMSYSKVILFSVIIEGAALIIMGFHSSFSNIAVGRLLFCFFIPIANTIAGTLWISKTPKELQGRVYSARIMVVKCIIPFSYLLVGPLTDKIIPMWLSSGDLMTRNLFNMFGNEVLNYRIVFILTGFIVLLCAFLFYSFRDFRKLNS